MTTSRTKVHSCRPTKHSRNAKPSDETRRAREAMKELRMPRGGKVDLTELECAIEAAKEKR